MNTYETLIDKKWVSDNTVFDQVWFKEAFRHAYPDAEYFLISEEVGWEVCSLFYLQKKWGEIQPRGYPRCDYHSFDITEDQLNNIKKIIHWAFWEIKIALLESPKEISFLQPIEQSNIYKIMLKDDLYSSIDNKKFARKIKYKYNLLNRESGSFEYKQIVDKGEIKRLLPHLFDMHKSRREDTATPSQFNDEKNVNLYYNLIEQDELWVEMNILYINNTIAAMHFGFRYDSEYYYYKPVYSQEFWVFSPWIILICEIIKDCIADGILVFDFLRWEEWYKKDFSNFQTKNFSYKV